MIRLRDSILIDVPPERVWAWLNELPIHYREWHPAHVACWYERGRSLEVGAVLYVVEHLHDRLHRLRLRATDVVPGRVLRYRNHAFAGAFLVEAANGRTCFTAELTFGLRTPVLGDLFDAVVRRVLARRLATIQTHMREEGENLKRLVEEEHAA